MDSLGADAAGFCSLEHEAHGFAGDDDGIACET
jgi:hypothetical protein